MTMEPVHKWISKQKSQTQIQSILNLIHII